MTEIGVVDAAYHKTCNDTFYQDYLEGRLDIHKYLEFALEPLSRYTMDELCRWREEFMRNRIEPLYLAAANRLLAEHRNRGDYLLIITATNRFVTEPIAKALGVDDLIATEPEIVEGRFTGRIQGVPSYKAGKVTRLEHWLKTHPFQLQEACFYSDSHNDIPLLERVGRPVAVDADAELTRVAKERGWEIMSLRA